MTHKHNHGPNIHDPNCASCRRFGMPISKTVNRHLLDKNDPAYEPEGGRRKPKPKYGYHSVEIKKGVFGEISKVYEELAELEDAERMGIRLMAMCELSDIMGAIGEYAKRKYGLTMDDLLAMAEATRVAFEQGHRK